MSIPASDVHERPKTNGTAINIAKETSDNQWKKYNSVKHLKRQQDKYYSVSKNPESLSLCFKSASRCLLFSKMNSRHENRSKFSFYRQIYNLIFFGTFSFYLRWENISKDFLKFCKLISNLILGQIIVSNLTNVHN